MFPNSLIHVQGAVEQCRECRRGRGELYTEITLSLHQIAPSPLPDPFDAATASSILKHSPSRPEAVPPSVVSGDLRPTTEPEPSRTSSPPSPPPYASSWPFIDEDT